MEEYYVKSILQLISEGYNIEVLKEIANLPVLEKTCTSTWSGTYKEYIPYKTIIDKDGNTQKLELPRFVQSGSQYITTKKPTQDTIELDTYLMKVFKELSDIEANPNQVELIFKQKTIINSLLKCLILAIKI